MSKNAASEGKLGELHDAIASELLARLERGESIWDSKSGSIIDLPGATTATLSVIVRFLADNDITCVATDANKVGQLRQRLDDMKAQRAGAKVVNLADHVPKVGS